jgi:protein-S-isoprenylcysteine O-methyltransferase
MNRIFAKDDQALSAWSEAHYERLKKRTPAPNDSAPSSSGSESTGTDGNPDISWPLERPTNENGDNAFSPRVEAELRQRSLDISDNLLSNQESTVASLTVPMKDMLPGRRRAQSGIALRAWVLGQIFSLAVFFAAYNWYTDSRLWRPAFFLACLSLFHFLEFWTHAAFNLPNATISAFLLFDNGWPYMLAHTTALIETTVTSVYFPKWQARFSPEPAGFPLVLWAGLGLTFVGQLVRSMAIMKAGTNFNHQIQHKKKETHELVTDGIYGILRHPSYFGFFWWAVGTQVVLGNAFCFWVYVIVLWRFFSRRILSKSMHKTSGYLIWANHDPIDRRGKTPYSVLRQGLRVLQVIHEDWYPVHLVS